jgi:hypothetical protein
MMKKITTTVFVWLITLILFLKTASTFTLCGGTLMQNWVGFGACTDRQERFIGFGNPFRQGDELIGVVFLCIVLIILFVLWRKYFKHDGK